MAAIQQSRPSGVRSAPTTERGKPPALTVQRAAAEAVFAPHVRVLRPAPPPGAVAEELMPRPGGGFQVRSAQRQTLSPPSGTFNFVRVHGETPRARPVLISAKLPHAQLAGGRPVVYAGTARFEQGEMTWWSNYSGTYQPIAAFRAQAGLPEDKFVPWQKLQMGGTSMQRGMFTERRAVVSEPANAGTAGAPGGGGNGRTGAAGGRPASAGQPASAGVAKR